MGNNSGDFKSNAGEEVGEGELTGDVDDGTTSDEWVTSPSGY